MEAKSKYCGMKDGCFFCDFMFCPGPDREVVADGNRVDSDRVDSDGPDGGNYRDSDGR